jgi:tetratricopeptide (TPR) repeat protein
MVVHRIAVFPLLFLLLPFFSAGAEETSFQRGEQLFLENKPAEAVFALEEALKREPRNEKAYLYLGIAYEQLGQYENAVAVYARGLETAASYRDTFLFNMANNYLRLGQDREAADALNLTLKTNGSFAPAYLNRGNLRVKTGEYRDAVNDYQNYITLRPDDPQRDEIERMISLLSGELQDQERRKLEDERKKKEEAARQQALLDQVLGSLENAGSDTTNLSAGTGESEDYDPSFDIID